jgi:uncharacterized protein
MSKSYIIVLLITISLLSISAYFIFDKPKPASVLRNNKTYQTELRHDAKILIGSSEISVQTAKTSEEKAKGLSGKKFLNEDEGMVFVFLNKTYPAFWMIDMNFPIDIIWISEDTIVHIDENVPPPEPEQNEKNLPLYRPPEAINYVLEVNAGFSQKNGIKVGDKVDLTNLK